MKGLTPSERVDALAARLIAAGATPGAAVAMRDRERPRGGALLRPRRSGRGRGRSTGTRCSRSARSRSRSPPSACCGCGSAGGSTWTPRCGRCCRGSRSPGITVHHLLSHTGGIVCSLGDPPSPAFEVLALAGDRPRAGRRALLVLERRLPGARAHARAAHRRALRRHVPARDHRTARPRARPSRSRRTPCGHAWPSATSRSTTTAAVAARRPARARRRGSSTGGADGSVCATAADLACYGRMLLHDGAGVLSAGGLDRMTTPVVEDPDDGGWYGYGADAARRSRGRRWVGHSGSMVGHRAQLWCDLDAGLAAAARRERQGRGGRCSPSTRCASRRATTSREPDLGRPRRRRPRRWRSTPSRPSGGGRSAASTGRTTRGRRRSRRHVRRSPVAIHWGDAWPLEPLADGSFRLGAPGVEPRAAALRHAARGPLHARLARRDRLPPAPVKYVRSDIGGGADAPVAFTPQPRSPSGIAAVTAGKATVCAELQESSTETARRTSAAT